MSVPDVARSAVDDPRPMRPTDSPTDATLLCRARAGDAAAFSVLFERHVPRLEGLVRGRLPPGVRHRISVSDVIQETRIAALAKCSTFDDRGEGAFRAWLCGVAEMQVRRTLRHHLGTGKRAAGREVKQNGRGSTAEVAGRGPSPSEVAIAGELHAKALRALASLPEDYREVLQLTQFEGLSLRDAAERMGRSRDATKKLFGRAMVRFAAAAGVEPRRAP